MIAQRRGNGRSPTQRRGGVWPGSSGTGWEAMAALAVALICLVSVGCVGYRFGDNTLYAANVRAIYVRVFP